MAFECLLWGEAGEGGAAGTLLEVTYYLGVTEVNGELIWASGSEPDYTSMWRMVNEGLDVCSEEEEEEDKEKHKSSE